MLHRVANISANQSSGSVLQCCKIESRIKTIKSSLWVSFLGRFGRAHQCSYSTLQQLNSLGYFLHPTALQKASRSISVNWFSLAWCFLMFEFIRPELRHFINAEDDKGEKPETPANCCSNPTVPIHTNLATGGCFRAEFRI